MRFKHLVSIVLTSVMLIVGCTSLVEKGKESFPELVTVDTQTQTSIQFISPTNLAFFTSLSIPVEIRISAGSEVSSVILLWASEDLSRTNLVGYEVNGKVDFTLQTNIGLADEGSYYLWTKLIFSDKRTVLSKPLLFQAYTNVNRVAAPRFSPLPGESANPILLVISSISQGATIFWTTNNWKNIYSHPSPANVELGFGSYEIRAYATKHGHIQSDTVVGSYTIRVASPQASPSAGSYTNEVAITFLTTTMGATIYWTTNNWLQSSSGPLTLLSGIYHVEAYATRGGAFSSTNQWEYIISPSGIASPIFTPESGTYNTVLEVIATGNTEGSTIYLSTNGTTWFQTNRLLLPTGTWTLYGYAEKLGSYSITNRKTYTITESRVASPRFSLSSGTYPTNITVTITCPTPGSTIYWTTNGWLLQHTSSSFSLGPGIYTVQAYATKTGLQSSETNTISYRVEDTIPPTIGGIIQVSNIQSSSATIYWPTASDNTTSSPYLRYLLVYTTNASWIDTITEVTNGGSGVTMIGWSENMTTYTVSGLVANTTYYVNVAVKDTSENTSLYTNAPISFTTPSASTPNGLLTIIFSNWNESRTLYLPGDHNNWDPNSLTHTHASGTTSKTILSNVVISNVISRGATPAALEFKVINRPDWVDQWVFSSWSRTGPITLYDSGRQIAITCDHNDVVEVIFDVGNMTIRATVEARP